MSKQTDRYPFLADGNANFDGGVDSNTPPHLLPRNQSAMAVNATMRGGFVKPRPGWKKLALSFPDPTTEAAFRGALFQHGSFYDGNGIPALLSSQGGRQFRLDLRTLAVTEITPASGRNSNRLSLGWSVQAEQFWIYQDNQSAAIIYDGAASRRARADQYEVPVGNVMCYAMGRLLVALPDRRSYRAGNLVFETTGTTKDLLSFSDNYYLNEGGDFVARVFGAPSIGGDILAMKAVAMADTQLGQGPVLIGQPDTVFTTNLPFDRESWKNLPNALQTASPLKGPLAQGSTVLVNGDLWYRATDGIRSYIMARRDFGSWGNTPMSNELNTILAGDTPELLEHGSAVLFDNRLLTTVSPVRSDHGVWHRGLAVMDFNLVSSLRGKEPPCWEGVWIGPRILQLVSGMVERKERCFAYVINDTDQVEVWELMPELQHDFGTDRIRWSLTSPSYNCGDSDRFKALESGRFVIQNLSGTLDWEVEFRSDQNPCWHPWDSGSVCALTQSCGADGPLNLQPQQRSPIRFKRPPEDFDTINKRMWRTGYEMQVRLTCTGYAELKKLSLSMVDQTEDLSAQRNVS